MFPYLNVRGTNGFTFMNFGGWFECGYASLFMVSIYAGRPYRIQLMTNPLFSDSIPLLFGEYWAEYPNPMRF